MPAVLLHGVPETPVVWGPLVRELKRTDVITLQLPGFGVPAPAGFGATKEEYIEWLISELETIGEPVDFVGHDWGGGFINRVACVRPDLLRSWVSDTAGLIHPDYVWHDIAQVWQTPEAGEQYFVDVLAQPAETIAMLYASVGMIGDVGAQLARESNEEMGRCILSLYRSAAQPAMVEWGRDAERAAARPGMALVNLDDPYLRDPEFGKEMGRRMGARVEVVHDMGHWWMLQDPARGAAVLEDFWTSLDN